MNAIQPIASTVPWQTVAGNHESAMNFTQYKARFPGLGVVASNSASASGQWYSFDDGLVHWVALDTEIWFYGTAVESANQLKWLKADLAKVDRSKTPWLLAYGHKQVSVSVC